MAKPKKKQKKQEINKEIIDTLDHPENQFQREILGIIILALAFFLYFGNTSVLSTGLIGKLFFHDLLSILIGKGRYLLPGFIAFTGLLLLFGKKITREETVLPGMIMAFIIYLVTLEFTEGFISETFMLSPINSHPGGIIGYMLTFLAKKLIGFNGLKLILISLILISFLMIFNITLLELGTHLKKSIQRILFIILSFFHNTPQEDKESSALPPKKEIKPSVMATQETPLPLPSIPDKKLKIELTKAKEAEPEKPLIERIESDREGFLLPDLDLLDKPVSNKEALKKVDEEIKNTIIKLEETLESFKVLATVVATSQGPSVTRYEIQPGFGVKVSKIVNLSDDIALNLAARGVRIEAPVPGKSVVGIEIPNKTTTLVNMLSLAQDEKFIYSGSPLLTALGKDIEGSTSYLDLSKMPHLLIAGATGSGKSICINSIITSLLLRNTPSTVRFIMIDPKKVELSMYDDIPHLIAPVVTDPKKAAVTLRWCVREMEKRYEELASLGTVRNIEGYNQKIKEMWAEKEKLNEEEQADYFVPRTLPYIIVIIDELADLMMAAPSEVETSIARISQMARAVGIHLVIATQRPSVDVITGLIKANIPSRISFAVSSQIDSRTILDSVGSEKLLGKGDMLYKPVGAMRASRIQGVFLSDSEVHRIVKFVKSQGQPEYLQEVVDLNPEDLDEIKKGSSSHNSSSGEDFDDFFEEAKEIVTTTKKTSISFIQRKLRIGYNRAARLMEELEEAGIVSEPDESGKREILSF